MGFSVAVASAILFTAFLVSAAVVYEALNESYRSARTGDEGRLQRDRERQATKIEFVSGDYNNTTSTLNLTVLNNGTAALKVSGTEVLVNGTSVTANITNATVEGKVTDIWAPAERLFLSINITASTPLRIKVITGNGVSAYGVVN